MEYNGRVYVYSTNDIIEYDNGGSVIENTYGQINQINCISSDDMVNWTTTELYRLQAQAARLPGR